MATDHDFHGCEGAAVSDKSASDLQHLPLLLSIDRLVSNWPRGTLAWMRFLWAVALWGLCTAADAQQWFTITGNPGVAEADTIEVDLASIGTANARRTAILRVSRSHLRRSSWVDVSFRSFVATTEFDCAAQTGRYLEITYWAQPLWTGQPLRRFVVPASTNAVMRFRGVEPNPASRILRAACDLQNVRSATDAPHK